MTDDDIEVVSRTLAYDGYMRLDEYRIRQKIFGDGWSPEFSREVVERGHAVAVLPYDPAADAVVLIEQFRIGAHTAPGFSSWQIECVAGMIENGDSPEAAARRELGEETGLEAGDLVFAHHYLSSPGCTSESVRLYCARVDAGGAGGIHGNAAEHEYMRVFTAAADDALAMADSGEIENGMTLLALHWLRANRARLRGRWNAS